jgi:GTP diphosphokinase / guanosine-3',5'-bis(diphosphate) 3'-diphosphatase
VRDLRVILVKLADRTHNLRTMDAVAPAKRRQVARETLDIYAPVAERLGLYSIKLELEELGFRTLYPQRYRVIERALRRARGNQKEFLAKIQAQLEPALAKAGIQVKVETREKHLYSVYKKMQRKRAPLAEIVDVYGLRIIVDSVDTCYRAVGVVHSVYKPMPGRFKDYIAIPRVNGYQSLHTTLFGPNAVPIEVQIRTADMDQVAESGIAAHWKYKEHASEGSAQQERARAWLSHLMQMQESGNSEEFIESVKVDLFPDKVYVGPFFLSPPSPQPSLPPPPRHRGRFRLRGAHRRRQPLRRRQGRPPVDTAAHRGAQRPDHPHHHRQGRAPEPGLGELRGHRQGAQRHPSLSEGPEAA